MRDGWSEQSCQSGSDFDAKARQRTAHYF